jgi:protein-S-isoprenylcysteine O-methyltransferase Ste14
MFRWFALAVLVACLGISTYYRRRARLESETIPRRREGALLAVRALLGLSLLIAIVAHVVMPGWMVWASFRSRAWVSWVGLALGLLAVPAVYWVFDSLGRNVSETVLTKRNHQLVTTGPYRWVRHPLYATGLTLLLAVGLMLASWLVLLATFIALALIWFVVVPVEEAQLLVKFGDAYRTYSRRTGRLLPRLARPT